MLLLILEKGITNFILHPEFTIHFATINTNSYTCASNKHKLFTIQKQESIQSIDNIRFLDVFCVLTVHYSNRQI